MAKSKSVTKVATLRLGAATKKKVVRGALAAANVNVMLTEDALDKKQAAKGLVRKKPALKKAPKSKSLAKKDNKENEVEATELATDIGMGGLDESTTGLATV